MAPRRQTRKLRLSRMDAAIDAMSPYGFAENHVRKVVKLLLKEYGGNEGWPFIEEFSYKELIEAILRDLEACDGTTAVEPNPSQDEPCADEEPPAKTSSRASDVQLDEGPQNNASADIAACSGATAEPACPELFCSISGIKNAEADGTCPDDILPDQTSGHIKETTNLVHENDENPNLMMKIDSPRISGIPVSTGSVNDHNHSPTNRRRGLHCYGWIGSNDEDDDDDFINLEPGPMVFGEKAVLARELSESPSGVRRMRKSRWDERPDDH